ncbi:MAG: response regulator [Planctomycetota bacterium]
MDPHTVLIVDDERHITFVLKYKLEDIGLHVITAHNGKEGLERATAERPSLVITDFQMPYMSGIDLARALREQPTTCEIPVVMITARAHRVGAEELVDTNVCELIQKPFSPSRLLALIGEILDVEPTRKAS